MDALPVVPAVVLSFGATYYLGKACLMLVMSTLEQPARGRLKAVERPPVQSHALPSADTIAS
ncbi:MAG TPA: hypothetical protein VKT49_07020 [Bryobacteraceae bacterium]|nr:hypothetical protein [Bryobacteraceae bacterium]